jgi:transcriptional regulator with XRE-family HTH domain
MANIRVKDFRTSAGLSQTDLADLVGCCQNTISAVERSPDYDLSGPTAVRLCVVAEALGIPLGLADIYPGSFNAEQHARWLGHVAKSGIEGADVIPDVPIKNGAFRYKFGVWFASQVQAGRLRAEDKAAAYAGWEARA